MTQKINFIRDISFIVPCYNEEDNIIETLEQIKLSTINIIDFEYEIVIVNDASTDNTLKKVEIYKLDNKNIKILSNKSNLGLGGSIKRGFKAAKFSYLMYLPGDNCHSHEEIRKLLLTKDKTEVVLSYYENKNDRPFFRKMFTLIYTPFLNLIFRMNLPYYNGIAIYQKNIIDNIDFQTSGFTWQIELLVKLFKNKNRTIQIIPTLLNERNKGKSKAFKIKNCFKVIYSIFSIFIWSIKN